MEDSFSLKVGSYKEVDGKCWKLEPYIEKNYIFKKVKMH